jgi:hypothetical protein
MDRCNLHRSAKSRRAIFLDPVDATSLSERKNGACVAWGGDESKPRRISTHLESEPRN